MHVPRSGTKTLRDRAKCCSRCLQETFLATTLKTGRGEACLIGQYICVLSYHNPYFLFVNVKGHLAYVLAPLTWPSAPCSCHGQLESNDVFILDRHGVLLLIKSLLLKSVKSTIIETSSALHCH